MWEIEPPGGRQPGFMNTSDPTRKVHIRTYGCQMNVYDSERMADALAGAGYAPVNSPEIGGSHPPQYLPYP